MTNDHKIGIAVIGTGFGSKVHIPAFAEHPKTEVLAVYNRDLDKAKAIASKHNIPHALNNLDDLLALPDVQGVSISTPPFLHFDMAKKALHAGKHLLLEKPTTLTVQEARELYNLAQEKDSITCLDFEFRFIPAWQHFAELLKENYVGQKRLIKIDWLVSSRADENRPWNWYAQKDKGGGALGAIGSHSFDYIRWLFGSVKRLCGQLNVSVPMRPDPEAGGQLKPVDADDICTLVLELEDGTPCQICLSSATYQGRGHWVEVYGSEGTLILGSDNQQDYVHGFRLWGSKKGGALTEISIPEQLEFPRIYPDGRISAFLRVVDNWVTSIEQGKSLEPSLKEGVYSQLLMDLTHESNNTGTWVTIPNFDRFLTEQS